MLVPYSLRELPLKKEDHRIENDFSCLCFTLGLNDKFSEAIKAVKKQTRALKTSIYPYGVHSLIQLIAWFPGILG